ncbi:HPr-rel-A system PqqD family peptide chaperone [Pedomonas mirosovicensis]|uniref:HPr-rel-A system PqqD family peptide chaperone n=1 Tax=Pedomonas mirosovicensis TaxID=2908641 RepID=UPI002168567D|nr:HPr-rel-A system PqqD family peptide chaperone [Pedomonas mirosovicensis]MCH8684335.1 HPr-rel-A system PqqD family peptide chaperone [Pedomonas mirosovicensis]
MNLKFRSSLSRDCVVQPVDGLFLVFFRPSGQTHLLPVQSFALLELLDENSLSVPEIPAALAARYDVEPEVGIEGVVERQLRELQAAGLVEAAT